MNGADFRQQQELEEYEMWLADKAGIAEYESWLKKLDEHSTEEKEIEYAAHE